MASQNSCKKRRQTLRSQSLRFLDVISTMSQTRFTDSLEVSLKYVGQNQFGLG